MEMEMITTPKIQKERTIPLASRTALAPAWRENNSMEAPGNELGISPSLNQRENRPFAAETKFLLSLPLAAQVRDWARVHLAADPHAAGDAGETYQITSLYFDTERFNVFHRRGSYGRSKFRIRRYGHSDTVFLERKLKTRGLVTKRRSAVQVNELSRLTDVESPLPWVGDWYRQRVRLRQFHPVCQITYCRVARVAMTDRGPIRLTLDYDLRAVRLHELGFQSLTEGAPLADDKIILELKYRYDAPLLFKLLAEEFVLNPQPVSKYRLAVTALGLASESATNLLIAQSKAQSLCLNS